MKLVERIRESWIVGKEYSVNKKRSALCEEIIQWIIAMKKEEDILDKTCTLCEEKVHWLLIMMR